MKQGQQTPGNGSVPSPCINICQVDTEHGWCTGCLRTLEEIADWAQSSDEAKRAVLDRLAARRRAIHGPDPI